MSVEERLLRDAQRIERVAADVDKDALLGRIAAELTAVDRDRAEGPAGPRPIGELAAGPDEAVPQPSSGARMSPLAEIKYHLGHALHSASCARRTAELFELLGYETAAETCWRYAADCGDQDALDYVAEFVEPPPTWAAVDSRTRFVELADSFR